MINPPMANRVQQRDVDSFSSSSDQPMRTTAETEDATATTTPTTASPEREPSSPTTTATTTTTTTTKTITAPPSPGKPLPPPPPGTYVIQIPKDQIYRVPPPENGKRFEYLSRRKPRLSRCRSCLCLSLAVLLVVLLLAGISAAILYLVFRPESPHYSIEAISIDGFNLTSPAPISPEFDVTVRADNPNNKIGIYYRTGSSVNVYYNDVRLCSGYLPVFYQGANNLTVFQTALKGSGIQFNSAAHKALIDGESRGTVPFRLGLKAPVKLKIGAVKTWTITVKINCDVTVDKLTADAKVVSKKCRYSVDLL